MIATFALAVAVGGYRHDRRLADLAIGVASILAALAYTGGPFPLGYHGLGELTVFLFFGPVAAVGTAFVASGALPTLALLASIPAGALVAAVLVVNNLRDRATDVGRQAHCGALGPALRARRVRRLLIVAHAPLALAAAGRPWLALGALTALLAVARTWRWRGGAGPGDERPAAATAQLLLLQAAALTAALFLG
jgi:1,4-dihydroxy-2-naphthoate octaprenyltransferase